RSAGILQEVCSVCLVGCQHGRKLLAAHHGLINNSTGLVGVDRSASYLYQCFAPSGPLTSIKSPVDIVPCMPPGVAQLLPSKLASGMSYSLFVDWPGIR